METTKNKRSSSQRQSRFLGTAVGTSIGAGVDAATGFTDEGLFTAGLSSAGGIIEILLEQT